MEVEVEAWTDILRRICHNRSGWHPKNGCLNILSATGAECLFQVTFPALTSAFLPAVTENTDSKPLFGRLQLPNISFLLLFRCMWNICGCIKCGFWQRKVVQGKGGKEICNTQFVLTLSVSKSSIKIYFHTSGSGFALLSHNEISPALPFFCLSILSTCSEDGMKSSCLSLLLSYTCT